MGAAGSCEAFWDEMMFQDGMSTSHPLPTPEGIFNTFWDKDVQGCDINLQNVYNPGLLLDERSTSSQKGNPWSKTANYLYAFFCCCRCAVGVVRGTGDEG
jgi:hypothetical protein